MSKNNEVRRCLSKDNFRDFAQECIESYDKKGMLVDSLLWSGIIGHYERALKKAGVTVGREAKP